MSTEKAQPPAIRRFVTGHDANGKAVVVQEGLATNQKSTSDGAGVATTIWTTEGAPADFMNEEDGGARATGSSPPPNGTRFAHLVMQPGYGPNPVHRTDTLDYNIVLKGTPTMYLDDGVRVELKEGDVVIQRGTNHAWANHSNEPAYMIGVLVDGTPKREGSLSGMKVADTPSAHS